MVLHIGTAAYFVAHQIPLFLLAFGVILVGLAFAFKPLGAALVLPVGIVAMVVTLSWFVVANGGITNIPWDVAEVVGIGIVIIVIGRVFAG
jgi:hypothetical protein